MGLSSSWRVGHDVVHVWGQLDSQVVRSNGSVPFGWFRSGCPDWFRFGLPIRDGVEMVWLHADGSDLSRGTRIFISLSLSLSLSSFKFMWIGK